MKAIVLINGKARSGKDTVAEMLKKHLSKPNSDIMIIRFAQFLKEMCEKSFVNTTDSINSVVDDVQLMLEELKQAGELNNEQLLICGKIFNKLQSDLYTVRSNWWDRKNIVTRGILQNVGTEVVRDNFDDDYWISATVYKIKEAIAYTRKTDNKVPEIEYVLIPDFRFYNEYKKISYHFQNTPIITIKVERILENCENAKTNEGHKSEPDDVFNGRSIFSYTIENNGTLDELDKQVKCIASSIENNNFKDIKQKLEVTIEIPGVKTWKEISLDNNLYVGSLFNFYGYTANVNTLSYGKLVSEKGL